MQDCKKQILTSIPDNNCCSQTFVNLIVFSAGQINKDKSNILITSSADVLQKLTKIITNFYPTVNINTWDSFLLLTGNIYQVLTDINYAENINLNYFPNECDQLTILKTLFLTCGRFYYNQDNNANSKGYNLEFVVKDELTADLLLNLLKLFEFDLKKIKRQNAYVVYTKNSGIICDLLVKLGATYTALEVQNNLAMREIRNTANRQNNCYDANLDKTLNASNIQLEAISYILDKFSIDYLTENLREVALARIANPDVSLSELRMLLNNKISRAGIKYRLDKIIEIYNKIKGEN